MVYGKHRDLWRRQLFAHVALVRMGAHTELKALAPSLSGHPSEAIRRGTAVHAEGARVAERAKVIVSEPSGIELVRIEGGSADNERPQHQVTVSTFYLGKYPVTNEQYARYLAANPGAPEPKHWANREYNQARQPVVGVSWEDAERYAAWAGLRLPTEAEWEYACRAGLKGRYCSGETKADLDKVGWYLENSGPRLHAVGEKAPNAWGIHDMHGNVWEWCGDWYGEYGAEEQHDPTGAETGSNRVFRGGSWINFARDCRSAMRNRFSPGDRGDYLGFRLVAVQPGEPGKQVGGASRVRAGRA